MGYHPVPSAEPGRLNCSGVAVGDGQAPIFDIAYWKVLVYFLWLFLLFVAFVALVAAFGGPGAMMVALWVTALGDIWSFVVLRSFK